MGKLGRKICCNFDKNAKCILLVEGNKLCVFDETTEQQFFEDGNIQFGFCPLLPDSERNLLADCLKEEGFTELRCFRG